MSSVLVLEASFCGECGCLVAGEACQEHPEAILTADDDQVYIIPGVPVVENDDDVPTAACKRLIYTRCALLPTLSWAKANELPAIAGLLERQADEIMMVIDTINPSLGILLRRSDKTDVIE